MSVISNIEAMDDDSRTWIVRMAVVYFFRGAQTALRTLGDRDGTELRSFARNSYIDIERPEDILEIVSSAPDYRGLVCCVMDDLGLRDHDQRERVLNALTLGI